MKRPSFDHYVSKHDRILTENTNEAWYNPLSWGKKKPQEPEMMMPPKDHGANLTPRAGKDDQGKRILTNPEAAQVKRGNELKNSLVNWTHHVIDVMFKTMMDRKTAEQKSNIVKSQFDRDFITHVLESPSLNQNLDGLKAKIKAAVKAHIMAKQVGYDSGRMMKRGTDAPPDKTVVSAPTATPRQSARPQNMGGKEGQGFASKKGSATIGAS